ncbi:MAG: polysaccharide biosynthesis C-terminal domain-containing protein [Pseudomonadota bacterium]
MSDLHKDGRDLARGALTVMAGFVPRTLAGLGFLYVAGNLYGAEALGRYYIVIAAIELMGAVTVFGAKRALFPLLNAAEAGGKGKAGLADVTLAALLVSLGLALPSALGLHIWLASLDHDLGRLGPFLAALIPIIALIDILLSATRHWRTMGYDVAARSIAFPWTRVAASGLLGALGFGIDGLMAAYGLALLASAAIALFGFARLCGISGLRAARPRRALLRAVVRAGAPVMLVELMTTGLRRADILLVGLIAGPAAAGPYGAAKELATTVEKTHQLFTPVLAPVVAQTLARRGGAEVGRRIAQVTRWVLSLQLAQFLFFWQAGAILLGWMGAGFAAAATPLLILLGAEVMHALAAGAELPVLYTRPWLSPLVMLASLAAMLLASIVLIPPYGALGAALAMLVAIAVMSLACLSLARRLVGANILAPSLLRPLIAAGFVLILLTLIEGWLAALDPAVRLAFAVILALVPYGVLLALMGLAPEDRAAVSALLGKKRAKRR